MAGCKLVERDPVTKSGATCSRNTGEKARRGLVPEGRTHSRVLQSRNNRKLIAVLVDDLKILRELVIPTSFLGDKVIRVQAERRADTNHAPSWFFDAQSGKGLQPRECERDTAGAEKLAAWDIHFGIQCFEVVRMAT